MERIELNSLCKHIKKIRRSHDSSLANFCNELSFFPEYCKKPIDITYRPLFEISQGIVHHYVYYD